LIVEPFILDHYREMGGDNLNAAILNQVSGPAFTLREHGRILAIGGIRVAGIGQAWAFLTEQAKRNPKAFLRAARATMTECMATERLYRIYTEATVDKPTFFKHLGFAQQDNLWVR